MLQRMLSVVVVSLGAVVPAAAEAPTIDHQPVACVVAGKFPRLDARFAPAETVARARVQFQAEGTRHWYGVAMARAGTSFAAVLPQPKKSLKSYRYYVEVTDAGLGTARTPEYTTIVAATGALCADLKKAEGLASAAVRLEVPPGAPSVPGGFSTSGVIAVGVAGAAVAAGATTAAAAGGGIPAAVFIGGGLAVAGAGAVVATRGGEEAGPQQVTYEGAFSGQFSIVLIFDVPDRSGSLIVCNGMSSLSGTATVTLDEGTGASGNVQTTGTSTPQSGSCPSAANFPLVWGASLTGSTGSLSAISQQGPLTTPGPPTTVTMTNNFEFAGASSGGAITGTLTFTTARVGIQDAGGRYTGAATVTIPVTLTRR